jgi:hypothetical protein
MKFWQSLSDKRREAFAFGALLLLFILIRLPGLSLPYHQDEWKTAWALKSGGTLSGLHHPPLTQILFNLDGALFGADHLRILPFLFSVLAFTFLYLVIRNRIGRKGAFFALGLFVLSLYSVFASLMIDTDGSILPAFFLIAVYFFDRFKNNRLEKRNLWAALLIFTLVLGFMTKLSFIITIGAIALDFLLDKYKSITKKQVLTGASVLIGFFGISALVVLIIHYIYPTFEINSMISHAASYAHLGGRNYFQSMIQGVKSLYYLSPLLIVPLLFSNKEVWSKMRVFYLYLILGFVFYFVLFDFSSGALDKYLMFAIVPLSAISGMILARNISFNTQSKKGVIFGILVSLIIFALNFLPQDVIGLYPKAEWFSRVLHLRWQMLNPFTGGDGPLGFYVSFLFIGVSFLISALTGFLAVFKKEWRQTACVMLIAIGFIYNAVFVEEMLLGKINGSAPVVLASALDFIKSAPQITQVITYNDSGAYELNVMGKYANRFYAAPQYEDVHRKLFSEFTGEYLIIDMPHLYQSGFYGEFFSKCHAIYSTSSGKVNGYVVSCPKSDNVLK